LDTAHRRWQTEREGVVARAANLRRELAARAKASSPGALPGPEMTRRAIAHLVKSEDTQHGGWGSKKFPRAPVLELLLDSARLEPAGRAGSTGQAGDETARSLLSRTLHTMAWSALHDPLGGGFHRYTIDREWRVPHYEKMLYDNAQLAPLYAEAGSLLGDPALSGVARDTLDSMVRDLWVEPGGFGASLDADTLGEEGTTYTWSRAQIHRALPAAQARLAIALLQIRAGPPTAPRLAGPPSAAARPALDALFAARQSRPQPGLDTKRIVAWNGLAIGAFARGGLALDDASYLRIARRVAEQALAARPPDGSLPRTLESGAPAGVLADYALLAEGLLCLHRATGEARWLTEAAALYEEMQRRFADPAGGYWETPADTALLVQQTLADLGGGALPDLRPLQEKQSPPSTRMPFVHWRATLSKYPDTSLSAASQWTRGLAGRASRGAALRPIMGDFFPWSGLTRGAGYLKRDNAGYGFPTLARVTARQRARLSVIIAGEETAALRAALVGWPVAVGLGAPAGFSAFDNKVPGRAGARAYACRDGVRGADGGPGGAGPAACGAVYSGGESVKRGVRIGGSWVVGREVASEATVARSRIGGSARSKSRRHASCNQR